MLIGLNLCCLDYVGGATLLRQLLALVCFLYCRVQLAIRCKLKYLEEMLGASATMA